ncbi:MAG: tetratricopeptide (TPR) repeat protein [Crocinitomix sp.]
MNQKKINFAQYFESKMAKDKKQTKTQAKADELDQLTSTESFIDKYKKPLIIGAGALVVIVLGIIGYQKFISDPHELESREAYWPAYYEWEQDSIAMAITGSEDFDGMEDIAAEYSGTSGGNIANYTMALAAMDEAQYQDALDYFDECDFDDIIVGSMVLGLKGDCYVELDDYASAADMFEDAASREVNEFTTPMYLLKAGLTYEALDNNDAALTAYEKIKNDWSNSDEAQEIDKYIARVKN